MKATQALTQPLIQAIIHDKRNEYNLLPKKKEILLVRQIQAWINLSSAPNQNKNINKRNKTLIINGKKA